MTPLHPPAAFAVAVLDRLRAHAAVLVLLAGLVLTAVLCTAVLSAGVQARRDALQWQAQAAAAAVQSRLSGHESTVHMLRTLWALDESAGAAQVAAASRAWRDANAGPADLVLLSADTAEAALPPAARARDAGQLVVSREAAQLSFWLPLYGGVDLPAEPGQRRSLYRGALRYALSPDALLAGLPEPVAAAPKWRLLLAEDGQPAADGAASGSPAVVFDSAPRLAYPLKASASFLHAGHTWTLEAQAPARPPASALLLLALAGAGGVALSLAMAAACGAVQRWRTAAQAVAVGMAHELNQPIAALMLSSFNARAWLEQDRPDRAVEAITKVEQASQRMARMVAQWPMLAREGRVHLRNVNLAESLARAMQQVPQVPTTLVEAPDRQLHVLALAAELEHVVSSLLAGPGPDASGASPGAAAAALEIRTAADARSVTIEILWPAAAAEGAVMRSPSAKRSGHALPAATCRRRLRHLGGDLHARRDERGRAYVLTLLPGA